MPQVSVRNNFNMSNKIFLIKEDIRVIHMKKSDKVKEFYISKMEDIIMVNGKRIECKDMASFITKMEK